MELVKKTKFNSVWHFNDFARDRFIESVAAALPPNSRVLDAGAGTQKYRRFFSHCVYESQDFCQAGDGDPEYGKVTYVSDITNIPVPSETFDFVLCTEVIEHVPRPDLVVQELARVLRPGGEVVFTAPMTSGIHMQPYHYFAGFSPYWYRHFLPLNGLDVMSCEPNGNFFRFYGQESRRFVTLLIPKGKWAKLLFLPVKLLLSLWFKAALTFICHAVDRLDQEKEFTVGYFVRGKKRKVPPTPPQKDLSKKEPALA